MDRKDFLKYCGVALIGIIGLKGLISLLSVNGNQTNIYSSKNNERQGFGSGKYGA